MGKYKNLMSVIKTITDIGIMSNDINVKTVEHLGTIAPDVATNISLLKGWMKGDTIYAEEESSADETKQPSEVSPLLTEGGYYRFDHKYSIRQYGAQHQDSYTRRKKMNF